MNIADILVLIIEQNAVVAECLNQSLRSEGLSTLTVSSENAALALLREECPGLVVLGSLPGQGSIRMVRAIRTDPRSTHVPLTMMSSVPSHDAIVRGLDAGADDYLKFPCSGLQLGARVRALLRRAGPRPHERVVRFANIKIYPDSHLVYLDGAAIKISHCCYDLLTLFVAHPGRMFSREEICALLSKTGAVGDVRVVDVKIMRLRKALLEAKFLIRTVRQRGYMLTSP